MDAHAHFTLSIARYTNIYTTGQPAFLVQQLNPVSSLHKDAVKYSADAERLAIQVDEAKATHPSLYKYIVWYAGHPEQPITYQSNEAFIDEVFLNPHRLYDHTIAYPIRKSTYEPEFNKLAAMWTMLYAMNRQAARVPMSTIDAPVFYDVTL